MSGRNWEDLKPRVLSGLAMIVLGLLAVWLGGIWWRVLVSAVCGLMVWELVCMLDGVRSAGLCAPDLAPGADLAPEVDLAPGADLAPVSDAATADAGLAEVDRAVEPMPERAPTAPMAEGAPTAPMAERATAAKTAGRASAEPTAGDSHAGAGLRNTLSTWWRGEDRRSDPRFLGVVTGVLLLLASVLSPAFALPLLLVPSMLGLSRLRRGGVTYAVFTALILLAGYGMIELRSGYGLRWMLWLVVVVVVTDVAGYFAGRYFGGPKFWPRVSPKKTWSGTAAGWVGAAVVGLIFAGVTPAGLGLMGISVAVAMASQIGDIAESAIKRRAGVKDSSSLIPGHGGLLDRFDGMLGASVFLMIAGQAVGFPPGV